MWKISILLIKRLIKLNAISTRNGIYGIWKKIRNFFLNLVRNFFWVHMRRIIMLGWCIRGILNGTELTVISQHKLLLFPHSLLFLYKLTYTSKIIGTQLHNYIGIFGTAQDFKTLYQIFMFYLHQYIYLLQ